MTKDAKSDSHKPGWLKKWVSRRDTIQNLTAVIGAQANAGTWRGLMAVPPGSSLETLLAAFRTETDIPLELPFFAFLHFVSGYMLSKRVRIVSDYVRCWPELWTVVLAESGAGKTWAHDRIAAVAPVKSLFPGVAGGAAFMQGMQNHNFGLWFQDEIAQKLKSIEAEGSPLADIKEYLMQTYSNGKIERATKLQTITIDGPVLGILGINTPESFHKALSAESLLDGFAQRWAYVYAAEDPERSLGTDPERFSLYNTAKVEAAAARAFAQVLAVQLPQDGRYTVGPEGIEAFRASFGLLYSRDIPQSFFRRIMFRGFKYAALYHLLLGKTTSELDAADFGWAARVCFMHLQDVGVILRAKKHLQPRKPGERSEYDEAKDAARVVEKGRRIVAGAAAKDLEITPRLLQQRIHGIRSAQDAKALCAYLLSDPAARRRHAAEDREGQTTDPDAETRPAPHTPAGFLLDDDGVGSDENFSGCDAPGPKLATLTEEDIFTDFNVAA